MQYCKAIILQLKKNKKPKFKKKIVNEESHHSRLFQPIQITYTLSHALKDFSLSKLIQYGKVTHAIMFNDALNI